MDQNQTFISEYAYNQRNLREVHQLLDDLFINYSKVLVVRLDLCFNDAYAHQLQQSHIKDYIAKLRNYSRSNKIFNHMLTYLMKLEYGQQKGWHLHAMFFFDGNKVINASHKAIRIGDYWVNTIVGQQLAYYFNCHARQYEQTGIGMVEYHEIDKRRVLNDVAAYFCKFDEMTLSQFPSGQRTPRTFFRGQLRVQPNHQMGRPRMYTNAK